MRNIWTIAKRDYRAYFTTPIGYIVIAVFLAVMGLMFFANLDNFARQNMMQAVNAGRGQSITDGIIRPLYGNMNVIFLFMFPIVTMRLFAEERRQQTLQLLMTSPITLWEIILGKFFSALFFCLTIVVITLVYPAVLFATGNPDWGPIAASVIGTVLLMSSYLAIGIFCSALTEHQIIAFILAFGISLIFWLISWATQFSGPVLGDIFMYLSLISHFYGNFSQGVINTADVAFYLAFTFVGLFLTHRVLDSYRWR